MVTISKNVAMGILFFLVLLPISSCALLGSDECGTVAVAIRIPESIGRGSMPSALREAFAPRAGSRFIHPGTRLIEVSLNVNGGAQVLTASATVAEDATSASVTLRGVPYGTHSLTVSLYASDGVLLSRGTASVNVDGRAPANASVSAVPVTEKSFLPGPFGANGTTIAESDYGTLCIYRLAIPNAGTYGLKLLDTLNKDPLGFGILALYDANGQTIPFASYGSYIAYAWIPVGDCYVVVDAPVAALGELQLSLDADLRVAMLAAALAVNPSLSVQDRMRPFSISIPCGYSGKPTINFGGAAGKGEAVGYPDPLTISVSPGTMGLSPYATYAPGSNISFKDALLGFERTNVSFSFSGAPRTFIYCNAAGTRPSDSEANAATTLNAAITLLNGAMESIPVVIALADGEAYSAGAFGVSYGLILMGGCSPDGTRTAAHGVNEITFSTNRYAISISAADTQFDSVALQFPGGSITAGGYPITTAYRTLFKNCTIRFLNNLSIASASPLEYSLLFSSTSDLSLDGCSIVGPNIAFTGSTSFDICAVRCLSTNGTLRVSNSVINPGAVVSTSTDTSTTMQGISWPTASSVYLTVAGSTISSGLLSGSYIGSLYMRSINIAPGATNNLNVANSLLIVGNFDNAYSAFLYSGNTIVPHLNNLVFGYANIQSASYIIYFDATNRVNFKEGGGSLYGTNPVLALSSLSLASTDPMNPDFLMTRASSPASLRTGGADLSIAATRSSFYVSGIESDFIVRDRLGTARTGNGSTGFSVGAFEAD